MAEPADSKLIELVKAQVKAGTLVTAVVSVPPGLLVILGQLSGPLPIGKRIAMVVLDD